ncbi:Rne/Rng family ribonuclease [Aureimonas ureilytica]|uniref:Rne/Rng family ribonuclease n=1 Tax=Aureimonas ureilytica TaxID=401562 RepID=UPI0003A9141D|nr:ribonuclease E/G [Aureimonas ureilytica]
MANKMLIDASHPEETRVVVVKGNRIEEFDFESEHKKQIKGNIYLAKVTRVEPSLQAAFVEYGGNRHGFLAFSEIHPDYYQIPVADRQALIEDELARAAAEDEDEPERKPARESRSRSRRSRDGGAKAAEATDESISEEVSDSDGETGVDEIHDAEEEISEVGSAQVGNYGEAGSDEAVVVDASETGAETSSDTSDDSEAATAGEDDAQAEGGKRRRSRRRTRSSDAEPASSEEEAEQVDEVGSEDAMEEVPVRSRQPRKQYKIQEVIKRRQILLVQVVKEERGSKGAALTTYLSLAGRYSVLMPNTARGGGISRKITNAADRKRLKEVVRDLEVPRGMGIILRTAGANRTKAEVKRDYEYLMRLWETVRTLTLQSTAPTLVYEEGSLIKRSIRDLYNKDIDQVLVAGDAGYREAKDFMRMLMPSQAKVVQPYRDQTPIFARQGIEAQLDKMLQPNVTLKSGGYIIINQTEALVAIDVNSGRSTREHSIEDTAYQTNLEAAEEIARQLRLRDLAGLIVIDFIDMEEKRNNRNVEKRLKDCLKDDRARIQIGRISHFGLLEMSRQRIRASVLESTMQTCPVCNGNGFIRSASSLALHVLRTIEEHLQKHGTHDLIVRVPTATALYVLNEKRRTIDELEAHHGLRITLEAVDGHGHQHITIEHGAEAVKRPRPEPVRPVTLAPDDVIDAVLEEEEAVAVPIEDEVEDVADDKGAEDESRDGSRRRRRRRRNGRKSDQNGDAAEGGESDVTSEAEDASSDDETVEAAGDESDGSDDAGDDENGKNRKRRRRGRRGGRRTREDGAQDAPVMDVADGAGSDEDVPTVVSDDVAVDTSEEADDAPVEIGDVAARSFEPEMTDAVDAIEGVDLDGRPLAELEADRNSDVPDENEVMAATAEAGALIDENPPLDEVFPSDDAAPAATETAPEASEETAETSAEPRTPRLTNNGVDLPESEEDTRPKRSGWWSRRGFL